MCKSNLEKTNPGFIEINVMYRTYGFILALVLVTASSFGQTRFGIQGSGQIVNLKYNSPPDAPALSSFSNFFKPMVGLRIGVMADIELKAKWSIRPQLLYSAKGTKFDFGYLSAETGFDLTGFNSTVNYNYLELPIQVVYGLKAGVGRAFVGAGPYAAYLLSASETTIKSKNIVQANLKNGSRMDYGLTASAGYELPGGLTASAYYLLGLANLDSGADTPSTIIGSASAYHRTYGITVGYFFGSGN